MLIAQNVEKSFWNFDSFKIRIPNSYQFILLHFVCFLRQFIKQKTIEELWNLKHFCCDRFKLLLC